MIEGKGYSSIKPWGGHPRWGCDTDGCAFDALDEERMADHVQKYHRFRCDTKECSFETEDPRKMQEHAARKHNSTIVLVDSYGRNIDTDD